MAKIGLVNERLFRTHVSNTIDVAIGHGTNVGVVAKPKVNRALRKMLKAHAADERLILSDENLAGPVFDSSDPYKLYPHARQRILWLKNQFRAGNTTSIFLCVRNYPEFFNATFAYQMSRRKIYDLEKCRNLALKMQQGWLELVTDLCAIVGPERTVVWTHNAYMAKPSRIGCNLTGYVKSNIFKKGGIMSSPVLSSRGVKLLDCLNDMLDEVEHENLAQHVAIFPFDAPDERVSFFDANEVAGLSRRYAQDLADIAKLGCELIT